MATTEKNLQKIDRTGALLSVETGTTVARTAKERGRSPAVEPSTISDAQIAEQWADYLRRKNLDAEYEKIRQWVVPGSTFHPLQAYVLLARHSSLRDDAGDVKKWMEARLRAHPEEMIALSREALAQAPRGSEVERQALLTRLYAFAVDSPAQLGAVKAAYYDELARAGTSPDAMLTLTRLLEMKRDPAWYAEVKRKFEKMNPGEDISEYVAIQ